ncbi:MAG: oligoendopeptidase F family protein [Bacilli bacterium]|nr:oligoendopeptidase F family protein [Bacilli bacterium]
MQTYNNRSEVPDKYKWNLNEYFKNEDELKETIKKTEEMIKIIPEYKGTLKDSNKVLECMDLIFETGFNVEDIYVYTYLVNDQELGNSNSMKNKSIAENLYAKYSSSLSFFDPEILSLNEEEYKSLFKNKGLDKYKFALDQIYRAKSHVLSENEERIITEITHAADHFDDMSSTMLNSEHDYGEAEIDGEKRVITPTNLRSFLKNKDASKRKEIRESYSKTLENYGTTSAQLLNGYVSLSETVSKIRKYENSWDAKLFNLNIPNKVFETLVNVVENHVSSLQEYFKLYKSELGLDELTLNDLSLEMSKNEKKYSIEDAQKLCLDALKPLGNDYLNHFKKVFDNNYIDYCTYKGKCSGGYSFNTSTKDSRILLSFNGDLEDVSTIIHEGGHNVHHQYVKENNPAYYREISSLVCEVASLTNECLLSSYLAKNGESITERKAGIDNILGVIISNLFGAVREGKMEQDFHNEYLDTGSITKDYMDKLTVDSLKKYYGNTVKLDEYANVSWMRRSHYYMDFYLYSYAICISVASYVAKNILDGDSEMLDKYIKFLSTGGDTWPIDAFKVLGIDLTESKVYEEAINYFDSLIEEYKKINN